MVIHDSTTVITKKKKKKNINIYIEGRTIKDQLHIISTKEKKAN